MKHIRSYIVLAAVSLMLPPSAEDKPAPRTDTIVPGSDLDRLQGV